MAQYDFGLPGLTSTMKSLPHPLHTLTRNRNNGHNLPSKTNEQGCGQIRAFFNQILSNLGTFAAPI